MTMGPLKSSYRLARQGFLQAAGGFPATLSSVSHPATGPDGEALATDIAWLGPRDAPKVLMVVSSTHGAEGYAGSACQAHWLDTRGALPLPADTAVCLVHAINPYGFAWMRRVTEEGVDLNRNVMDFSQSLPDNESYNELADLIVPDRWDANTRRETRRQLDAWGADRSDGALQAAISGGQYSHPEGVFYGGTKASWSQHTLQDIARSLLAQTEQLAVLDLHTGLGPFGEAALISADRAGSSAVQRAQRWYGAEVLVLDSGESPSSPLEGVWTLGLHDWLPSTEVTSIFVEWGTIPLDPMIDAVRGDHWLHAYGDPLSPIGQAVKAELRAAFSPAPPRWAAMVGERFLRVAAQALAGLSGAE